MNKKVITSIIAALFLSIGIISMNDYLPPRTPLKVARIHSDLNISKSSSVVYFKENYTLSGEGEITIKLKLDNSEIEKIKNECINSNFKKLTVKNLIEDNFLDKNPRLGFLMPNIDLRNINNGYYKLKTIDLKKNDLTMIILDLDKNELYIWILIP